MSVPYYPSLEEVERLADQGNMVPVYREVSADLETPVSAYIKVARPPYSFLLESVEGGEHIARYSFIGTEPLGVVWTWWPARRAGSSCTLARRRASAPSHRNWDRGSSRRMQCRRTDAARRRPGRY